MEKIDFNHLYYVKGQAGVWSFKKQLNNSSVLLVRFGTSDAYLQAKPKEVYQLGTFPINTTEGPLALEKVIDWLFADCEKPEFVFDFDKQTDEVKIKLMNHYVPNWDGTTFHKSHMAKIYKWFNELYKALDKGREVSVAKQEN